MDCFTLVQRKCKMIMTKCRVTLFSTRGSNPQNTAQREELLVTMRRTYSISKNIVRKPAYHET